MASFGKNGVKAGLNTKLKLALFTLLIHVPGLIINDLSVHIIQKQNNDFQLS